MLLVVCNSLLNLETLILLCSQACPSFISFQLYRIITYGWHAHKYGNSIAFTADFFIVLRNCYDCADIFIFFRDCTDQRRH